MSDEDEKIQSLDRTARNLVVLQGGPAFDANRIALISELGRVAKCTGQTDLRLRRSALRFSEIRSEVCPDGPGRRGCRFAAKLFLQGSSSRATNQS